MPSPASPLLSSVFKLFNDRPARFLSVALGHVFDFVLKRIHILVASKHASPSMLTPESLLDSYLCFRPSTSVYQHLWCSIDMRTGGHGLDPATSAVLVLEKKIPIPSQFPVHCFRCLDGVHLISATLPHCCTPLPPPSLNANNPKLSTFSKSRCRSRLVPELSFPRFYSPSS
ncbi:hypothetical protein CRV24_002468 [Beauveria bassiana]|nr:hypothetical protein CRV24_002468 [Beauveria bassiana]